MHCLEQTISNILYYGIKLENSHEVVKGVLIKRTPVLTENQILWINQMFQSDSWFYSDDVLWFDSEDKRSLFLLCWTDRIEPLDYSSILWN